LLLFFFLASLLGRLLAFADPYLPSLTPCSSVFSGVFLSLGAFALRLKYPRIRGLRVLSRILAGFRE
jgi:hypothetical protein